MRHLLPLCLEQIAVEDREGVLAVKHAIDGGEAAEEGRAGDFDFHIESIFDCCKRYELSFFGPKTEQKYQLLAILAKKLA